jgi:4-amino-4-deoxy-L-arabinose transferase-like glycosyltransferase
MHRLLHFPVVRIAALALTLALLFLGHRGIWDPDEGRYTNVALHMLDTGNWIEPHRSDEIAHWTKPPLAYWAIASSVAVFGHNPWAARLPAALSYLLCVWLAWRIALRLAPGSQSQAALAYATMLFPIGAAQLITTDYVLAACETLAMWAFVEARFGARAAAGRWLIVMWAGFALAFLAKGPPGLLPLQRCWPSTLRRQDRCDRARCSGRDCWCSC